jgi:hypothetical protein
MKGWRLESSDAPVGVTRIALSKIIFEVSTTITFTRNCCGEWDLGITADTEEWNYVLYEDEEFAEMEQQYQQHGDEVPDNKLAFETYHRITGIKIHKHIEAACKVFDALQLIVTI